MNRMGLLEEMSWVLGVSLLIWIVYAAIRESRKPPPGTGGGSNMDMADGYFLNEWCDGDG